MFKCSELSLKCAKGMLIALNLLFMFESVCTFSFATVDLKILSEYGEEEVSGSVTSYVIIIAACLFLILLSFIGCLGTVKESPKILCTYIMLLAALLVLEVIIAIFVSVQRFGLQYRVTEWLRESFYSNATGDAKEENDQLWKKLETDFECCGLYGPEDYAAIERPISHSCCHKVHLARTDIAKENMYRTCIESNFYYKFGCEEEILWTLKSVDEWFFCVAFTGFWLEAAGMLLAMFVTSRIKNSVHVYKHTVKY